MLLDSRRAKRLTIAPDSNTKLIPSHLKQLPLLGLDPPLLITLLRTLIGMPIRSQRQTLIRILHRLLDGQCLSAEVDAVTPSLEELGRAAMAAHGLEGVSELERADGCAGE